MKISTKLLLLCLFFALSSIVSCGPGVDYNSLTQTGMVKSSDCPLDIFMPGDILPPNYHRIGMIDVGENLTGTSMSCGQKTVIEELKKRACAEGADVVQIYKIKPPSMASTCYRMSAYFFTYKDPRGMHSPSKQTTSKSPPSVKSPAKQQAQEKLPSLQIPKLAIVPNQIPRGTTFKIEFQYIVRESSAVKNLPVEFNYQILRDGKVLIKSKPKIIWGKNGILAYITKPIKATNNPGSYQLEVALKYGEITTKKTTQFVIE